MQNDQQHPPQKTDTLPAPRARMRGEAGAVKRTSTRRQGVRLTKAERAAAQDVFLDVFAASAIVTVACRAANVTRQTVDTWLEHDEAFSLRYNAAKRAAEDVIRAAIHEHAIRGWDEPVVSMGKVVYVPDGGRDESGKPTYKPLMQHKYDSALLAKMAAARLPEYKPAQSVDLTSGGHSLMEDLALTLTRLREGMLITDGSRDDTGNRDTGTRGAK